MTILYSFVEHAESTPCIYMCALRVLKEVGHAQLIPAFFDEHTGLASYEQEHIAQTRY